MRKRVIIFVEGRGVDNFWPLGVARPPYLLRCGATLLWEKWARRLGPREIFFFCRPELAETLAERTNGPVNRVEDWTGAEIWLLDGRWLLPSAHQFNPDELPANCRLVSNGRTIGLRLTTEASGLPAVVRGWLQAGGSGDLPRTDLATHEISGTSVDYLWDVVDCNPEQIKIDFEDLVGNSPQPENRAEIDKSAVLQQPRNIYLGSGARIGPLAVLNAEGGPIIIAANAEIQPHSYIEGPAVIGEDSVVCGAKILGGTTIGPVCRVGGEIEASVFLGWANKHHDGFLGHSVIGEWANLGAMTTNSDLKNNYSPVRVTIPDRLMETGLIKVGCFLADHTKTGIGTLIPTGGTVGFAANIFGGGEVAPKYVPEFVWGGGGNFGEHRLDQAKRTAERVCRRRRVEFTAAQGRLFDLIYEQSQAQRNKFMQGR